MKLLTNNNNNKRSLLNNYFWNKEQNWFRKSSSLTLEPVVLIPSGRRINIVNR